MPSVKNIFVFLPKAGFKGGALSEKGKRLAFLCSLRKIFPYGCHGRKAFLGFQFGAAERYSRLHRRSAAVGFTENAYIGASGLPARQAQLHFFGCFDDKHKKGAPQKLLRRTPEFLKMDFAPQRPQPQGTGAIRL